MRRRRKGDSGEPTLTSSCGICDRRLPLLEQRLAAHGSASLSAPQTTPRTRSASAGMLGGNSHQHTHAHIQDVCVFEMDKEKKGVAEEEPMKGDDQ